MTWKIVLFANTQLFAAKSSPLLNQCFKIQMVTKIFRTIFVDADSVFNQYQNKYILIIKALQIYRGEGEEKPLMAVA